MSNMKDKNRAASAADKMGCTDPELQNMVSMLNLLPSTCAASAIQEFSSPVRLDGDRVIKADFSTLLGELRTQNEYVFEGDLSRVEAMLLDQSHTLQAIFTNFAKKMANAEYISQVEAYSRVALKAQNQCRQTLATLADLKNPKRATFIKQQNNAVNQQINQGENQEISEKPANKILEEMPHERLDSGSPHEAIRADQTVEALGEGYRAENPRRKA